MKKFLVNISRTEFGFIKVEAETKEDAEEKAIEQEGEGMANWTSCEEVMIDETIEIK